MTTLNRVTRRITLCASLAIVAAMAAAIPLKQAAADNDAWQHKDHWRNSNGQGGQDHDWNGGQRYYGGSTYYYYQPAPTYYYQPAPTYYQPYYQPRPYYSQPGINFNVVIP